MDEFMDSFLSSSSWSSATLPERSSWSSIPTSQINDLPLDSFHGSSLEEPNSYIVSMDRFLGNMPIYTTNNHVVGVNCSASVQNPNNNPAILHEQTQLLQKLPETLPSDNENAVLCRKLLLPGEVESELASRVYANHTNVGANDCDHSLFVESLEDTEITATVTPKWLSAYSSMHLLNTDSVALQDLTGRGGYMAREADILAEGHTHEELLHAERALKSSNRNLIRYYDDNGLASTELPAAPIAAKPHMRARRGQATDPHSIAERLRREKISERMKNLQELVPNSNRTDKASMLDEIIEYVKFLQLQVKVLSLSRVGVARTAVPLLTDYKPEEARGQVLAPSMDTMHGLSISQDDIEFEQEVLKLMESNISSALQFIKSKGLCLMPVALAAAISGQKDSSIAIPPGRKKPILTAGVAPQKPDETRKEKLDRVERLNAGIVASIKHEQVNKDHK